MSAVEEKDSPVRPTLPPVAIAVLASAQREMDEAEQEAKRAFQVYAQMEARYNAFRDALSATAQMSAEQVVTQAVPAVPQSDKGS